SRHFSLARLRPLYCFVADPPPPHPHPLSLHDALPIFRHEEGLSPLRFLFLKVADHLVEIRIPLLEHLPQPPVFRITGDLPVSARSEEHTSELQSRENLVCRLLLERKKVSLHETSVDMR